jgi:hypothetical protein
MTQVLGCICCASLLAVQVTLAARQVADPESSVTVTATIEAIDKASRTVTLKRPTGGSVEIKAPEEMEGFNSLRVGDQVTATYFQALAVTLRKAGDAPPPAAPTTTTVRKDRAPGSESRRQQTFTVSVAAIDPKAPSVTVKTPQGRVVSLGVRDAKELQNIKVGDTVDVTYYESLLIKVARPPK